MRFLFLTIAVAAASLMEAPTTAGATPHTVTDHVSFLDILENINASTPLNWTWDQGADFAARMVFVGVDTWNSAKAVLESAETSTSPSGPELDGGGRMVPYNATHTLDNDDDLHIDLYCLNAYTHVSQAELFAYVSTIENQLRTQGGPGSYTWAIDNPADTSVTLWYNANIMIWDATVHAGMIWGMFKLGIMYKMCNDDRGLARGALVTATHTQIQREVVYVEAYATKWIPRYWP